MCTYPTEIGLKQMLKSVIEFKVWVLFFSCGFNLIPRDCSNYIYSYSYEGDGIHSLWTQQKELN